MKQRAETDAAMKAIKEEAKTRAIPDCAIEDDEGLPDIKKKPEHHRAPSFDQGDEKVFSVSLASATNMGQDCKKAVSGKEIKTHG